MAIDLNKVDLSKTDLNNTAPAGDMTEEQFVIDWAKNLIDKMVKDGEKASKKINKSLVSEDA